MSRTPSNLSRRQFLVHSAGIAGASLGLGTARSGRSGEPGSEVRLGFVGLGERGRQLLGAALANRQAVVAAVCDIDPERLKKGLDLARTVTAAAGGRRPGPRGFTDCRALIDSKEVDAVFLATPVFQHASQTIEALAAGKHVYCEKPMGLSAKECREVLTACREAEKRGQIYQAGLQRRYNPRYRRSIEYIHGGDAGSVLFVRAQWHAVSRAPKGKLWLNRREKSGDIVLEQATHQFDVFNWVFRSPPLNAYAVGGRKALEGGPPGRDVCDHYGAIVEYPGGGLVQLSHVTYSIPERRFSGIYELVFCEHTGVDLANALTWTQEGRTRNLSTEGGSDTSAAVDAFIDALVHGRRPAADAEAAYRATVAALMCRNALDQGRRVTFAETEAV